ncbi:MAG TPA: hypothetical protein PK082_05445 [Phycisphaerae bacterium]|nr:hypothetical protein [Phycisphaerae bacterium]
MSVRIAWMLAAAAVLAGGVSGSEPSVPLSEPMGFAHVGLRLALPADQKVQASRNAAIVLVAEARAEKVWQSNTTVYAVPAPKGTSLDGCKAVAAQVLDAFGKSVKAEKAEEVSVGATKVAGRDGWSIVRKFTGAEQSLGVASTAWDADATAGKGMYYVVFCAAADGDAAKAQAFVQAVCQSVALSVPVSPSETNLPPLGEAIEVKDDGFSLAVPHGWFVRRAGRNGSPVALNIAVADYTASAYLPNANVTVVAAAEAMNYNDDAKVRAMLDGIQKNMAEIGWTYLSHRATRIGGLEALEYIAKAKVDGLEVVQVGRQVFHDGKFYTVTLTWKGSDPSRPATAMDRLMTGFRLAGLKAAEVELTGNGPFFQCEKCQKVFAPDRKMMESAPMGPDQLEFDCPHCNAKKSGLPMVKCPACGKWYVPPGAREMMRGEPPPADARDVCPHCNTDRIQWYREHRRRR